VRVKGAFFAAIASFVLFKKENQPSNMAAAGIWFSCIVIEFLDKQYPIFATVRLP